MTAEHVKHFLIIYNIPLGLADVVPYDTDYAGALDAYAQAEERWRDFASSRLFCLAPTRWRPSSARTPATSNSPSATPTRS